MCVKGLSQRMPNPYQIPLLRDLHDHFPDLLYRPERFRTVPDILEYIIRIADQSPYRQGRHQYTRPSTPMRESGVRFRPYDMSMFVSSSSVPLPSVPLPSVPLPSVPLPSVPLPSVPLPSVPLSTSYHDMIDILSHVNEISFSDGNTSMDPSLIRFLGSLFQNTEASTDATHIRLTSDIIARHTQLQIAQQTQEDQCAICQDHMNEGQSLRTILHCNHVFHQSCIDVWFQTHATCPTCRHRVGSSAL